MKRSCRLVGLAGTLACIVAPTASALAQECRLGVSASDTVLTPGETAQVHVWAHFPQDAYAFASADFDVSADIPQWTFASDGVIAGATVFNITPSQAHDPFQGVFADPSNPIRVWTGIFEPASYDPMLVEVQATPTSFWYYPSKLTSSSVQCAALPGREWLYINPEPFAAGSVAPGKGTTVEIGGLGRDVLIAGTGGDRILIGTLLPAIQKVRMGPWSSPDELTIEVGVGHAGGDRPTEQLALNYTKADSGGYEVRVGFSLGIVFTYAVMHDGVEVATFSGPDGVAPFSIERLPDAHRATVRRAAIASPVPGKWTPSTAIVWDTEYDEPVGVVLQDGRRVEADGIEVRVRMNNLKQMGLASHVVHDVRGQKELTFKFEE